MSGRSGRYWSLSKLKQRGWTNELIRALLPKPRYIPQDGAVIRKWDREDVLAAEGSPRFANRSPGAKTVSPPQARQTCAALQRAWSAAKTDDSAAWVLAGHYHAAIISRMPAASKNVLCMSQATAWLSEFLALEQRCDAGLVSRPPAGGAGPRPLSAGAVCRREAGRCRFYRPAECGGLGKPAACP